MMFKMLGLAAVIALVPAGAALAQGSNIKSRNGSYATTGAAVNQIPQPANSHFASGAPARDGCVNIPGEAHNSADCSRIDASDMNTARNTPSRDLSGRPTGASENAERNARILSGESLN